MKIVVMSDTHCKHRQLTNLPEGDVVVHTGDFANIGTEEEVLDFLNWFCDLPYKHQVFVCGNHDEPLLSGRVSGLPDHCHQLIFSSVVIEGVKISGFPFFLDCEGDNAREIAVAYQETDVDILISHQPPHGILDFDPTYGHFGSPTLLRKGHAWRPKYHLFGHMHEHRGEQRERGITFINAAQMGDRWDHPLLPPIVIEL